MKKAFAALLLLSMLICVSCTPEVDPTDETWSDEYIYFYKNTLLRINVETATAGPVCPDPLCRHDDDSCPFYGAGAKIQVYGQNVFYIKPGSFGEWGTHKSPGKLCQFNLVIGKYEVLYEPNDGILTSEEDFLPYKKYIYISLKKITKKNTASTYEYYPVRVNTKSGKVDYLSKKPSYTPYDPYAAENGRIFWRDDNQFYSTGMNGDDRINGDRGYSELSKINGYQYSIDMTGEYYISPSGGNYPYYMVTRTDSEGKVMTVLDGVKQILRIYDEKILYMKYDDQPTFLGSLRSTYENKDGMVEDILKIYDDSAGKVYCCEPDGSGERVLCDFNGTKYYTHMISSVVQTGVSGIGDWIVTEVFTYIPAEKEGFVTRGANAILLLNVKTGEYKEVTVE